MARSYKRKPLSEKSVFSTGELCEILGVSPQTVKKYVRTGQLQGYHLPMGKNVLRVTKESLLKFLRSINYPIQDVFPNENGKE